MTASFAGRTPPPTGLAWTITNLVAMAAVLGFCVAAWGLYRDDDWWETVALGSAVVGLLVVVPFFVGMRQADVALSALGAQINVWMHIAGSVIVIGLVRATALDEWFTDRLR